MNNKDIRRISQLITEDPDIFNESMDFNVIWNYFNSIEKTPNADDLITLGNLIIKNYPLEDRYRMLSDMLPSIAKDIIPKLSEDDQERVKAFYSKISDDPGYQQAMVMYGFGKHLDDPYQFNYDIPLINHLESYMDLVNDGKRGFSSSYLNKIFTKNKDLIESNPDFVKKIQKWVEIKQLEGSMQPSIADMLKKLLKDLLDS
jgi:hypothetical protein